MANLPEDWPQKSLDEKMTVLMEKLLAYDVTMNKKLEDIGTQINNLQKSQGTTSEKLSKVTKNVPVNAEAISQLNEDVEQLKEERAVDMTFVEEKLSNLSKSATSENGSINPKTSSELVISGIPSSVAEKLSPFEVSVAVLRTLELPNLINDILTVRKFKSKNRSRQNNNIVSLYSYIVLLKSSQVRDFIIAAKRKSRGLLVKSIFPMYVDQNFKSAVYVNEFLLPETYRLLRQTKNKAKAKNFEYVWVTSGQIFVKKDVSSEKIAISSDSDLNKLD